MFLIECREYFVLILILNQNTYNVTFSFFSYLETRFSDISTSVLEMLKESSMKNDSSPGKLNMKKNSTDENISTFSC